MDLIFVRQGAPIPTITSIASNDATGAQLTKEPQPQQQPPQQQTLPQAASPSHYARFDQRGPHGCTELFNASEGGQRYRTAPPAGVAVAILNHPKGGPAYVSADWRGASSHPHGLSRVLCPRICFYQFDKRASAWEAEQVQTFGGRCPF